MHDRNQGTSPAKDPRVFRTVIRCYSTILQRFDEMRAATTDPAELLSIAHCRGEVEERISQAQQRLRSLELREAKRGACATSGQVRH